MYCRAPQPVPPEVQAPWKRWRAVAAWRQFARGRGDRLALAVQAEPLPIVTPLRPTPRPPLTLPLVTMAHGLAVMSPRRPLAVQMVRQMTMMTLRWGLR